ncbi:MAG: hypothetical protein RH946_03200 [Rhodospirillales bacterium]
MRIFLVRNVPVARWSSPTPLNLRPRVLTLMHLCFGLFLFGFGEAMLIASGAGVSPWTVLAQGVARYLDISIGTATFAVSILVLLTWIPLRQRPGIGTILNVIVIAATIELVLPYLPVAPDITLQAIEVITGILLVGLGSGIYLIANLGAGPRDGLMTGLQRFTRFPIAWVRVGIEVTVVAFGWILGGVVGIGTVVFALGIGPAVSAGLYLTAWVNGIEVRDASRAQ